MIKANLNTKVVVRLQVEGLHCWPEAELVFPEVGFLSDTHRHIFFIELKKKVHHDDRDIEFIMFKRDVQNYLYETYYVPEKRCYYFSNMSCEMIATELLRKFKCDFVSVFEDNENGAEVDAMTYYGHTEA